MKALDTTSRNLLKEIRIHQYICIYIYRVTPKNTSNHFVACHLLVISMGKTQKSLPFFSLHKNLALKISPKTVQTGWGGVGAGPDGFDLEQILGWSLDRWESGTPILAAKLWLWSPFWEMDVSEIVGFPPKFIHFNRVFHYKPSILGYPYFWKHPNDGVFFWDQGIDLPPQMPLVCWGVSLRANIFSQKKWV